MGGMSRGVRTAGLVERLFELAQLLQGLTLATLVLLWVGRSGGCGCLRGWALRWFQAHAPDVEVFFEAIRLEQVGEFERADVAAAFPNLPLQINNHAADLLKREALLQQFIPLPFAHPVQPQALAGQLAIKFVRLEDLPAIHGEGHGGFRVAGLASSPQPPLPARRAMEAPC